MFPFGVRIRATKPARAIFVAVFLVSVAGGSGGCAVFGKRSEIPGAMVAKDPQRKIPRFDPHTLKVRRPEAPGADPAVGPGGVDYEAHPRPNATLDCEPPETLFKEVKLPELRACLASLQSPGDPRAASGARYRLVREAVPYLRTEEAPECLQQLLPTIAVPREIFFQAPEEGGMRCFSSRLEIEANETAGIRLPTHRLELRLSFPLQSVPENDAETRMLLLTWALSPFWQEKMQYLPAYLVPAALCRQCLGEKSLAKPGGPPPVLWP